MLTLYHAPFSRSSSILALIEELGASHHVDVVEVRVHRRDGSGGMDPRNPHPEGKVPYLVHGGDHLRERGAIVTYLTDMFPEAGLGRPVGDQQRGAYLSWLFYYQGVMEPVLTLAGAGVDHPLLQATFRDLGAIADRLSEALQGQAYLLGDRYSAADLLLSSPFHWLPDAAPKDPSVQDWIARCGDRPAIHAAAARDAASVQG